MHKIDVYVEQVCLVPVGELRFPQIPITNRCMEYGERCLPYNSEIWWNFVLLYVCVCVCVRERERERESREGEGERERVRQTDRQTDREQREREGWEGQR